MQERSINRRSASRESLLSVSHVDRHQTLRMSEERQAEGNASDASYVS